VKFTFLAYLRFCAPCFDHDAFMHRALHILDAPDSQDIFQAELTPQPNVWIRRMMWPFYTICLYTTE